MPLGPYRLALIVAGGRWRGVFPGGGRAEAWQGLAATLLLRGSTRRLVPGANADWGRHARRRARKGA